LLRVAEGHLTVVDGFYGIGHVRFGLLRHDDVLLLRNGCVLMDQSVVYSSKYCPVTPLVPLPGVGL
jgi:hypothetical protein